MILSRASSSRGGCQPAATVHWKPRPFTAHNRKLALAWSAANPSASSQQNPDGSWPPLQEPRLTFPDTWWSFQKADARTSLVDVGQAGTATQWSLNLIEGLHWTSLPLGFGIAGLVTIYRDQILPFVGNDKLRHYLLVLGLFSQMLGIITGNMMHMYEGWQVAPFRNPIALAETLDACGSKPDCLKDNAGQTFIQSYNNAWLRVVAYHLLFSFQGLGLACFNMAALGYTWVTVASIPLIVFISLVGPRFPRTNFTMSWKVTKPDGEIIDEKRPIAPMAWSLLLAFGAIALINFHATLQLFGDIAVRAWPPKITGLEYLGAGIIGAFVMGSGPWVPYGAALGSLLYLMVHYLPVNSAVVYTLPLLAPLLSSIGGIVEGAIAESTFNQWWHWRAVWIMISGFTLYGLLYWHMIFA